MTEKEQETLTLNFTSVNSGGMYFDQEHGVQYALRGETVSIEKFYVFIARHGFDGTIDDVKAAEKVMLFITNLNLS